MADDLVVRKGIVIPAAELRWQFSRSSGPGGQSVNTSDSRVSLSFDLAATTCMSSYLRDRALARLAPRLVAGVLTVDAQTQRSQLQNRIAARDRMAQILRDAIAPPPPRRRPTKPSKGARERRITGKKQRGQTKQMRRNIEF